MDKPITSNRLPMIEPVMLALTTPVNPAFRATIAMISSVALPKVAFNKPPHEGPKTTEISSVAVLSQPAKGKIAIAEVTNTSVEFHPSK